jgi:hypothetical protein
MLVLQVCYKFASLYAYKVEHSGLAASGMNCRRLLEHWDRGFEPPLPHTSLRRGI